MKTAPAFLPLLLCCLISALFASAQPKQWIGDQKLYYGAAYYPETWDPAEVDRDIERMKELNMNVMRMAEFSWAKMEPREGEYDFDWLHEIIEKLHANGIAVILGTPTATPPAWMWEKYPEIAEVNEDGTRTLHGARRSTSFTSEVYLKKSAEIIEKMAIEFGNKPGVIGWQTDNELHSNEDYSEGTRQKWHEWLKARYGSIANLNQIWATDLWSQRYDHFGQIPMPVSWMWHHPSLRLDWKRFNTELVADFHNMHIRIIKKHSDLPVTHDTMPGQQTDYEKLMARSDFMAVNNYHSFEAYDRVVSNYDRMRGYKKGYHWLFETAPNNSGGGRKGNMWFLHQPDGSMFAALWMNFALGGQGSLFWLWRQHRAGHEMPHGSIISAWGKPAANYEDLKELGRQLSVSSDFLMQNPVAPAEMAIVYSHESDMGLRIEEHANGIRYYQDWTYRFYLSFQDAHLHRDVLAPGHDFSGYKVLFAPLLPYVPEGFRQKVKTWVENGGTFIIGPMSGYRSEYWAAFTDHAMGNFEDWFGIEVGSRIPVGTQRRPAEIPLMLNFNEEILQAGPAEAGLWSESLETEEGRVLARYQSGMHHNLPAIAENRVGKGKVVVLGTDPGRKALASLLRHYAAEQGIAPLATGDSGVVVAPRKGGKDHGYVLVNIANEEKQLELGKKGRYKDLLTGKQFTENTRLKPYEVRVLVKQ